MPFGIQHRGSAKTGRICPTYLWYDGGVRPGPVSYGALRGYDMVSWQSRHVMVYVAQTLEARQVHGR